VGTTQEERSTSLVLTQIILPDPFPGIDPIPDSSGA
jgi:hypothetical protein